MDRSVWPWAGGGRGAQRQRSAGPGFGALAWKSERFLAAVRVGDESTVRSLVEADPGLAGRAGALHVAVLERSPMLVRILMAHGANARVGVYPHRDATSPFTIAMDRGYDDVVTVIREQEEGHRQAAAREVGSTEALFEALQSANEERVRALVTADPSLVRVRHPGTGLTPLDSAARGIPERFAGMAKVLQAHGAARTPLAAVALGDVEWLRRAHVDGTLANPLGGDGGLLTAAVRHDQAEVLALLLDFGLDPDERVRLPDLDGDEVVYTWGMPLWHAARRRSHGMAEMLLDRGADPNADVYASGTPMFMAYSGHTDWDLGCTPATPRRTGRAVYRRLLPPNRPGPRHARQRRRQAIRRRRTARCCGHRRRSGDRAHGTRPRRLAA